MLAPIGWIFTTIQLSMLYDCNNLKLILALWGQLPFNFFQLGVVAHPSSFAQCYLFIYYIVVSFRLQITAHSAQDWIIACKCLFQSIQAGIWTWGSGVKISCSTIWGILFLLFLLFQLCYMAKSDQLVFIWPTDCYNQGVNMISTICAAQTHLRSMPSFFACFLRQKSLV